MRAWKSLFVALVVAVGTAAQAALADPAAERIQSFYAALIDTMKRGPELGMQGRYHALEPAVDSTFDIPAMIQFIVGPGWANTNEHDKTALIAAFRRMTIANYAANFTKFGGEQFNVEPNVQSRGPDKLVQTTLVPAGDKPVPLNYRMRNTSGSWKVIDVFLEGYVSELSTRRSDFSATLASGGAPALIAKINQLADSLLNESAKRTK
jgi:phospholipid transport system substrate-binding protein